MLGGPKLPGAQFPGDDAAARRLRDIEREIQKINARQGILSTSDTTVAALVADPGSLTRTELENYFLTSQNTVIDGGTP
jgi:hypothetical protein